MGKKAFLGLFQLNIFSSNNVALEAYDFNIKCILGFSLHEVILKKKKQGLFSAHLQSFMHTKPSEGALSS